jgi:acetolactate synthase-1/2/3 large subunit
VHLGATGLAPKADALVNLLIERADLIILVRCNPIHSRQGWSRPWPADKPMIDLVAEALPHGMHSASLTHEGAIALALRALTAALAPVDATWPEREPAAVLRSLKATFAAPAQGGWGPHQVFATARTGTCSARSGHAPRCSG